MDSDARWLPDCACKGSLAGKPAERDVEELCIALPTPGMPRMVALVPKTVLQKRVKQGPEEGLSKTATKAGGRVRCGSRLP